ncbi:acyl-CoA synthetase (AMP-forming)/AMP-acid ligase II [Mycolicibacterium chubuense NBB4]|uniref:Acyl-CoA synthetase (AMP-forming)/AMP-acid ligase II n=1 Tax=Mycolicibacterium chubuense (strain NBB4) TaxID=710421 RepID=I4BKA9_MYCCN|nr:AMP-binding protein [Mycolicibacterium chubuense]AFM17716.1 acyl-CoA synthetase (AMP-forming)/AMP-acid ligase II [Mycolicibacterium chubuense NBB4]
MNLPLLPDRRAAVAPSAPCLADDDVSLANDQFLDAVRRAASALRRHGVGAGDVVAVMLPNTAYLVVAVFAAWRLGAAVTPLNPSSSNDEAAYQVTDAAAKVLIVSEPVDLGVKAAVVTTGDLTADAAPDAFVVPADPSALALLIYTSGTTGRPKGVMLDHANLDAMCRTVIDAFDLTSADHSLLILPLFHANGIVVGTLSPLLAGGQTTIAGRFKAAEFFDRVERTRATYFSAVPTIYTMLADLPADQQPDTSSLRFAACGAAPASVDVLNRFESRYGVPIVEGYGLSEGTAASTVNPLHGVRKPGTVGLPMPGQQVRIADTDGNSVADGDAGEVLIAGPNVMRGYLNRPEETAKTLVDGWLRTGDIGRFDEDGYLVLVDRSKDMIIRGGENIYPKEIETVAYRMAGVAEAAVVGRAHPVYGEEPVMFVSASPGCVLDAESVSEYLADSLTKYKRPVEITVLDALPKNAVGKIDKPALRRGLVACTATN